MCKRQGDTTRGGTVDFDPTPFGIDDELLQHRRSQREWLASVPDDFTLGHDIPTMTPPNTPRRGRVERRLRQLADTAISDLRPGYFPADAQRAADAELEQLVKNTPSPADAGPLHVELIGKITDDLRDLPKPAADPESRGAGIDYEQDAIGTRALTLLAWADDIAGDPRDPRLIYRPPGDA